MLFRLTWTFLEFISPILLFSIHKMWRQMINRVTVCPTDSHDVRNLRMTNQLSGKGIKHVAVIALQISFAFCGYEVCMTQDEEFKLLNSRQGQSC